MNGQSEATKAVALKLAAEIRRMFGKATDQNAGLAVEADAVDDLCDAVVARMLAAFAAVGAGAPLADLARLRHVKSGGLYTMLAWGAQVQTDTPLTDYAEVAVYQGDDGLTWVRPIAEMDDGRFQPVRMGALPRSTGRAGR